MRERSSRWLLSALAWALCSGLLLAAGFAALVAWIAVRAGSAGTLQRHAWLMVGTNVWSQALLPLWAATLASWIALVRCAPRLDRAWRTLAPGVALLSASWFAPVGAFGFTMWQPRGASDVLGTLALCAGGVSTALLLPRWLWRRLGPGAFATPAAPG